MPVGEQPSSKSSLVVDNFSIDLISKTCSTVEITNGDRTKRCNSTPEIVWGEGMVLLRPNVFADCSFLLLTQTSRKLQKPFYYYCCVFWPLPDIRLTGVSLVPGSVLQCGPLGKVSRSIQAHGFSWSPIQAQPMRIDFLPGPSRPRFIPQSHGPPQGQVSKPS